ncbi:hypothetical protein ACET3Z_025796 [Daucus carota]
MIIVNMWALGHLISACPSTHRVWVQKRPSTIIEPNLEPKDQVTNSSTPKPSGCDQQQAKPSDVEWETVKKKHSFVSRTPESKSNLASSSALDDGSPTPVNNFKNLKSVDEIDDFRTQASNSSLSKNQRKRLRKSQGQRNAPPPA